MSIAPLTTSEDTAVPVHVAIIMDGNGRWANARGKPRSMGHKAGAEAVRRTLESAADNGIKYLTLFSFSSENWKRPASEIADLMGLLRLYLKKEVSTLCEKGIRLRVIGDRSRLAEDIVDAIEDVERRTADNTRMTLVLALSYGSRDEMTMAARTLAERVAKGEISPEDIDEAAFEAALYTHDLPDPDLLIRTSGEKRISNFLLWQLAYTEFVFLDKHWPDFNADDLTHAIKEYGRRERRFGTSHT
ncbi:MAG: isoprenyl transferase [Rhodospirillales bacterium]|nr:isoprenyl transferase [Rhodospirillales bacterium]MBO6786736.1 isoprenyl transferase [Rhodospirillales bacterium]